MDIKTLEALGLNATELADRIVEQAVNSLLYSTGFNPETEEEVICERKFKREIEARIQCAVDQKIGAIAAEHIVPRIGEMVEKANMVQTNRYGEPKGEPMTFKEYIAYRAETYMGEEVDLQGRSKAERDDAYNWKGCGPRLTVLMQNYIRDSMETAAKSAVTDINKVIAKNIEQAAKDAIAAAAANIKVSVSD